MKDTISIFIVSLITVISAFSQNSDKYTESINEISEYLLENEFNEALVLLKDLESGGFENSNMEYLLGICYLNSVTEKSKAISYLNRASNNISKTYDKNNPMETTAPSEALLYLGDAYLVNNKIKEARLSYLKYLNLKYSSVEQKDMARARIKNCLFARLQFDNPINIQLENAGNVINAGIANSHACLSANGKNMVFLKTLKFYDGIYFTTKTDSGWAEPVSILTQVGSDGEFIPTSMSPDGSKILFKTFVPTFGYELFESNFNGRKWTKAKKLPEPLNSRYNETDANYASDGRTIYFSSNRDGGFGGYDIYKASVDSLGVSYSIENLGDVINTPGNEKSPSIINNGKVLVFNSDYRVSIGDYDYYYAQFLGNKKWSEPLNIGYPLNTTTADEDMRFSSLTPNQGVISKFDPKGLTGRDIFFFESPVFSTLRLIPISGKIKISDTTDLASRNITLVVFDEATKDTAYILTPNNDGTYFAELYPGDFSLIIKEGGKDTNQKFAIPNGFSEENFTLESKMEHVIPEIPKTDTLYLCDMLFDFNQFELSASEKTLIEKSLSQLKKYSVKSIRLVGYTDVIGNETYNKILSERRAQSVKDYFIKLGYAAEIITVEGKGSVDFVAKNTNNGGWDNPRGRAFNRRVLISVTHEISNLVIQRNERVPEDLRMIK